MKPSAWKDIAEIVALTAVIGGLIMVVIELRQTQSALRAQAYQTRALDVISTMRESSANPELAIGAVCEDGTVFIDQKLARYVGADEGYIEQEKNRQLREIAHKVQLYRKIIPKIDLNTTAQHSYASRGIHDFN